jgi:glycosyltransferase involved in cell wall biosynthesis
VKITYISQYFFPEQYFNNSVAKELVRRGHEVHVVTCVPNYGQEQFYEGYSNTKQRSEIWNGVKIDRAWTVARGGSRLKLALNYLIYPITASWTALRKTNKKTDISFVSMPSPVFQGFVAVVLKRFWGIPTVYWVQDIWPESLTLTVGIKNSILIKLLEWTSGWLYRQADTILVQNAAFVPMIERFNIPVERIRVLPNTANSIYRPISSQNCPEERKLLPDATFYLMFAGNVGESQDFDNLLQAAKLLEYEDNLQWIIIGSGRYLNEAKRLTQLLGLEERVIFLGKFPEERMPCFFSHADALLVSLKDTPLFNLTIPSKIQSYMACGRPIIAALSGEGANMIEKAQAGFAVQAGNPEQLAAAILKIKELSDSSRNQLGNNGLTYFKNNFEPRIVYDKLEEELCCAVLSVVESK